MATKTRITAAQRRHHADKVAAITNLRDKIAAEGHPTNIRINLACESLEIIESMVCGEMVRLIVWFGGGWALYIDSLAESGRYEIDQREETGSGCVISSAGDSARDVDDDGALSVYHRYLARYGLPEREPLA